MGVPLRRDVRDITLLEVEAWRAYDKALAAQSRMAAGGRGRSRHRRQ